MALKLVDDWRNARKWISVNCMALAATIQTTWALIPADMKTSISPDWITRATVALLVLGVIGRVVQQVPTEDAPP